MTDLETLPDIQVDDQTKNKDRRRKPSAIFGMIKKWKMAFIALFALLIGFLIKKYKFSKPKAQTVLTTDFTPETGTSNL